uniref:GRAM domain-containing protein n=1 Tax=Anopheles maculatus TaxID=74869 RepID=A0A182S659_9DIPT
MLLLHLFSPTNNGCTGGRSIDCYIIRSLILTFVACSVGEVNKGFVRQFRLKAIITKKQYLIVRISLKSLSPSARSSTIRSSSPHPLKSFSSTRDAVDKPEKHHKKKEGGMSWEQKKFAQHFAQVPDDEVVLDYFSCALVGDILLQGYLYITQNYFAFYSNVFGY